MNIYAIRNELLSKNPVSKLYIERYVKLIAHAIENPTKEKYKESHHILPKAKDMFPDYASFSEHPWNKVKLSARQHFIAHWMLWKAFRNESMTHAFSCMCYSGTKRRYRGKSSRMYENLRIDFSRTQSERMKKKWQCQDYRDDFSEWMNNFWTEEKRNEKSIWMLENNPFKGKKHSIETRIKLSERGMGRVPINKGVPMSDEQKLKCSISKSKFNYYIFFNDESPIKTHSLKKYAKENNMNENTLRKIIDGRNVRETYGISKIIKEPLSYGE